jgi:hypothetical protein
MRLVDARQAGTGTTGRRRTRLANGIVHLDHARGAKKLRRNSTDRTRGKAHRQGAFFYRCYGRREGLFFRPPLKVLLNRADRRPAVSLELPKDLGHIDVRKNHDPPAHETNEAVLAERIDREGCVALSVDVPVLASHLYNMVAGRFPRSQMGSTSLPEFLNSILTQRQRDIGDSYLDDNTVIHTSRRHTLAFGSRN